MQELKIYKGRVVCPQKKTKIRIKECTECPYFVVKIKNRKNTLINCNFDPQLMNKPQSINHPILFQKSSKYIHNKNIKFHWGGNVKCPSLKIIAKFKLI